MNVINLSEAREPIEQPLDMLDGDTASTAIDLLAHLPKESLIGQLAKSAANAYHLPANSVLLMGLAAFSAMATRAYSVAFRYGGNIPIGLYAVAEQPPAAGKSPSLKIFQKPFFKPYQTAKENGCTAALFVTNSTPEALEQTLIGSTGYFAAVSSEQGLVNSLLGFSYGEGRASNNDMLLNGFDGGWINSQRVTRNGYCGIVAGGVALFAQAGSIEKIHTASNGTGLAERFLVLSEAHRLGQRDHFKTPRLNKDLVKEYDAICTSIAQRIFIEPELDDKGNPEPPKWVEPNRLKICPKGWHAITSFKNELEPHLADNGKFGQLDSLRGAAGKADMQVMKIAANLHLLDGKLDMNIQPATVEQAISIVRDLLEANLDYCRLKRLFGIPAEFSAVIGLFEDNPKPRTENGIINALGRNKLFRHINKGRSAKIRSVLTSMVKADYLSAKLTEGGGVEYQLIK